MDENNTNSNSLDQIIQKEKSDVFNGGGGYSFTESIVKIIQKYLAFPIPKYGDTPVDANQLTPKKYVDSKGYAGHINSDGTVGIPFPAGWTCITPSTAQYRITHNLNTTNYSVVTGTFYDGSNIQTAVVNNVTSTSFEIWLFNKVGGNTNGACSFILSTK